MPNIVGKSGKKFGARQLEFPSYVACRESGISHLGTLVFCYGYKMPQHVKISSRQ
jgi:hypothetical protein